MPDEPKWTPGPWEVRGWCICDRNGFHLLRTDSKRVIANATLAAASPELYEALEPDDRLNAAAIIHAGYKSQSSVETMHLLHCCLDQVYLHPYRFSEDMASKIHEEIERLMGQAQKALAKAQGESPDAP